MDDRNKIKDGGRSVRRRFSLRAIVLAVCLTFITTLAAICGALWFVAGPQALSLAGSMALVRHRFVGDFDAGEVEDAAQRALVDSLGDQWSYYMNAEQYAVQNRGRNNAYVGIGVTVSYEDERGLLVLAVVKQGPAERAGILAGEIIIEVDGVSLAGEERHRAGGLIGGEEGSDTELVILSEDGAQRTVTITRERVEEDPVTYQMLGGRVGLITLRNFFSRSADGVKEAVNDLSAQGAAAFVFDLRNNPGGYLNELTDILDFLLPEGPIFRSRSRSGTETVVYSDESCIDLPVAVLVNADSYSAAEFFAAEMGENGAAVAGSKTSGKGYSQQTFPLPNGGALNLSTRAYFTGNGVSLIGTGLTPALHTELSDEQAALLLRGELDPEDDPQLQAALGALF